MILRLAAFCGIVIVSDVTTAFGLTPRLVHRSTHHLYRSDSLTPELDSNGEQFPLVGGNLDSPTSTMSTRREIVAFLGSIMASGSILCHDPLSASASYTASSKYIDISGSYQE